VNIEIQMHDLVALLDELPTRHFDTGAPLTLRRGQIGTVVMNYDGSAFEVEFSDLKAAPSQCCRFPPKRSSCCTTRLSPSQPDPASRPAAATHAPRALY